MATPAEKIAELQRLIDAERVKERIQRAERDLPFLVEWRRTFKRLTTALSNGDGMPDDAVKLFETTRSKLETMIDKQLSAWEADNS